MCVLTLRAPAQLLCCNSSTGLLFFPEASDQKERTQSVFIPRFDVTQDPEGVASHIPHMDHFFDNSIQTGLMRDMAVDLELLGEHLVLLGNQVGLPADAPGQR